MMTTLWYFAYGSNLHPVRLTDRTPSAVLLGAVKLPGKKLTFSKIGTDDSAKCTYIETGNPDDILFGALYQLHIDEKPILDVVEGKGQGYDEHVIDVALNAQHYSAFTYCAAAGYTDDTLQPYDWYKQYVVDGARYLKLPSYYRNTILQVSAKPDRDEERNAVHRERLARIASYND